MRYSQVVYAYDLSVPMRDGTMLRGDLYRPAADGKWPVLLLRTVFRKDEMSRGFGALDPLRFSREGYAVFIQDVRGLGRSDGVFDRFTADGRDGYDTVEWLAEQPFCNGRVGMIGEYYAGYLQLMTAWEHPPHLAAICPVKTSVSLNRDSNTRGFMFSSHVGWCLSRQISRLAENRYDADTTEKWLPRLREWLHGYTGQAAHIPLAEMPAVKDTPFSLLRDYYTHLVEGYDKEELIRKEGRMMDVSRIRIPAFYVSGWYDSARTAMLNHCLDQRMAGVDSRILVAPWRPGEPTASPDGALNDFAPETDLQADMLAWFDYWLRDAETPGFDPIRIGDPESSARFSGTAWPPETETMTLYAAKGGRLVPEAETGEGQASWIHDPEHPLGYRGFGKAPALPDDGRRVAFLSEPAGKAVTAAGAVEAECWISVTARDADVMISLGLVRPDGSRFILCDGATRIRYAEEGEPRPLLDGEVRRIRIRLGQLFAEIPEGCRLFAEFYGSAFPKYDVNHGTGERPAEDRKMIRCTETLYFGGAGCPTRIIIPVQKSNY